MKFFGLEVHRHVIRDDLAFLENYNLGTVIEIGANVGNFTRAIQKHNPKITYAFEPIKEAFDQLVEDNPQAICYNFGLSDRDETITMMKNRLHTKSSSVFQPTDVLKTSAPNVNFDDFVKEQVELKRLDSIELDLIDDVMISLDVEGYEYRIIQGGMDTLKKVKILLMETALMPMYEGQKTFTEVYDLLRSLGFEYKGSLHSKKRFKGMPVYEDALFINHAS